MAKWVKVRQKGSRKRHPVKFVDLDDLKAALIAAENRKPGGRDDAELENARTAMLAEMLAGRVSEFERKYKSGKTISAYQEVFGKGRGWMHALEDIAAGYGESTKQIYRRLDFFHWANRLPEGQLESILDGSLAATGSKDAVLKAKPNSSEGATEERPVQSRANDAGVSVRVAAKSTPSSWKKWSDDCVRALQAKLDGFSAEDRDLAAREIADKFAPVLNIDWQGTAPE